MRCFPKVSIEQVRRKKAGKGEGGAHMSGGGLPQDGHEGREPGVQKGADGRRALLVAACALRSEQPCSPCQACPTTMRPTKEPSRSAHGAKRSVSIHISRARCGRHGMAVMLVGA
jgi:hypothetical protein